MAEAPVLSPIVIVYLLVIIYALCYQLQSPLEPFLVEKLVKGESAATAYAKLRSFFSLVQLVGSFIVGFLIDRLGLRTMFSVNFIACALCYAILANTTSIELLYASKLPSIFQAGFLCAQTAAAKLTAPGAERASALGRLTSSYTIGATVGPTLGGFLGVTASAWLAVGGSLIAVFLVYLLPEDVGAAAASGGAPACRAREAASAKSVPHISAPSSHSFSFLGRAGEALSFTWPLLLTKMVSGFVNSAHGAVRPLLLKDTFGLDAKRLGGFMSAMFFGNALLGLQLGTITGAAGGANAVLRACMAATALGYSCIAANAASDGSMRGGLWGYMGLTLLLSLCQFPLATLLTSKSTACVPASLKGTLVGMEHAAFAGMGFLGPAAGVALLQESGILGFGAACCVIYAVLFASWTLGGDAAAGNGSGLGGASGDGSASGGGSARECASGEVVPLMQRELADTGGKTKPS